jgi:iron(III) transport system permease protein
MAAVSEARKSPIAAPSLWLGSGAVLAALIVALPIVTIVALSFTANANIWPHLIATVLPGYLQRTFLLMLGVGVLAAAMGAGTAWLVARHEFPLRGLLQWALLLPLAMPLYITSYAYVSLLNYSGPLQTALRQAFGWTRPQDYVFPEIRSLGGAIIVFAVVLYPYVFLTAQAAFLRQPDSQIQAARTLGLSAREAFFSIVLPQARPAIMVGVSLALMECLNDIAAANFFGVRTLTLGIYTTWLGEGNLGGAAQLASVLLAMVFLLIWFERTALRRQYHEGRRGSEPARRIAIRGWRGAMATLACLLPVALGFIVPAATLLWAATKASASFEMTQFLLAAWHSVALAVIASFVAVVIGLMLAYARRALEGRGAWALGLATMGYAMPGTILAIGVLIPLAGFDQWLNGIMQSRFGVATGLVLTGSMAALVYAYTVRFLAISFGTLDAGLGKVTPSLSAAARTLGRTPAQAVREVHLPILRPALLAAAILIFVDCMKELSATLILRPFDFDTLSTLVFDLASLDKLAEAAVPSLAIVAVGLAPVIILARNMRDPWFTH